MQHEQKRSLTWRTVDLLWRGSQIVAERIPAGVVSWVEEGKERNDRVLRWLVAGLLVVVPLLIAIRPKTLSAWLAVAGLTGAILVAARLAPILAVILVVSLLATTAPGLMWLFVIAWITSAVLAAWPKKPKQTKGKHSKPAPATTPAEPVSDTPDEVGEDAEPAPAADPLLTLLDDLIGESNGVHVSTVLEHLQRAGMKTPLDTSGLRSQIEALGVRVRPSLKVAGINRPGVHRDDLEAALNASPTGPPMEAPARIATAPTTRLTSGDYPPPTPVATPDYPPREQQREGFDAHADDALSLVATRRHGAA